MEAGTRIVEGGSRDGFGVRFSYGASRGACADGYGKPPVGKLSGIHAKRKNSGPTGGGAIMRAQAPKVHTIRQAVKDL